MAQIKTKTLDANDETFIMDIDAAEQALITMTFTGIITVTWTGIVPGGSNAVALRKSDDTTAAAYTTTDHIYIQGPIRAVGTASSVSGGTCAIEGRKGRTN